MSGGRKRALGAHSLLLGLEEPETVHDAPDVWANEASEEPLEETHEEHIVDETLVVEAGGDHGADARGHGDAVEDAADERVGVLQRHHGVRAAIRAA